MNDPRSSFLLAEAQANTLIEQLSALEKGIEQYSTATENIAQVRQSLLKLVDELHEIPQVVRTLIEKLDKIGTPEILTRVDEGSKIITSEIHEVRAQITATATELKASNESAVSAAAAQLLAEMTAVSARFSRLTYAILAILGVQVLIGMITLVLVIR